MLLSVPQRSLHPSGLVLGNMLRGGSISLGP